MPIFAWNIPLVWLIFLKRSLVFPIVIKSARTHSRFLNLGIWQRDRESLGNLTLGASEIWLQKLHGTGKTDPWGHKQNLMHTRSQEKGTASPKEPEPDLSVSVQESVAEAWVENGLPQGQGHWIQQCMQKSFWRRSPLSSHYLHVTSWTVAHQSSMSMGFPTQEYRSGLLFLSPGHLPNSEIKPVSPALSDRFFTSEPPGNQPYVYIYPLPLKTSSHPMPTPHPTLLSHYNALSELPVLYRS